MQINVSVTDANNIVCEVVPPQQQIVVIDRGVEGNGIVSIVPVTISTFQYLRITYTNGTVQDVGPLTSTAYTATSPITIVGNTISLATVPIASGGTDATTAAGAIQNLLPSYTGNANKRLGLNSTATGLEWVLDGGGTVTSVAASGGTTGLTFTGSPITTSGTLTLGGTLAVASGGTGVTSSTGTGSVVLSTSPTLVTPLLGTPTSGNFSTGTFTWPTFNQNTTGTAANITATSNSTLTTLSSLSLPYVQLSGTVPTWNQNTTGTAANVTGVVAIANGGTGQITANAALNALLPTQTGNASKYLQTDGTNATWDAISLSTADITGILPTANGGTGLSSFTANGVVYASSTSALTTGSALTFDGTLLTVASSTPKIRLSDSGLANDFGIDFYFPSIASSYGQVTLNGSTGGMRFVAGKSGSSGYYQAFELNGSEAMRLTSTGLGIGTSSPGQKLTVAGTQRIQKDGAGYEAAMLSFSTLSETGAIYRIGMASGGSLAIGRSDSNTTNLTLDSSGNLGIGTSSPTSKLTVSGAISASGTIFRPDSGFIQWNSTGASGGTNRAIIWADSSSNLFFGTGAGNSTQATIDSSGNLGLGVTPSAWGSGYKGLQVNSGLTLMGSSINGNVTANAYFDGTYWRFISNGYATTYYANYANNGSHVWGVTSSGTAGLGINGTSGVWTTAMTLDASGNLVLGTTSSLSATSGRTDLTINGSNTAILSLGVGGVRQGYLYTPTTGVILTSETNTLNLQTSASYPIVFNTNATERARIDSSGNFGIGTSSPQQPLVVSNGGALGFEFVPASGIMQTYNRSSGAYNSMRFDASSILFYTGTSPAERARIDSNGRMQIGTTSALYSATLTLLSASNSYNLTSSRVGAGTGTIGHVVFENDNGAVGTIQTTGSTTSYNTSSDYRLKNTIEPMTGALAKVALLKPCTYKWNADGSDGEGFIAHELAEVVPQAVTGEKDAVDKNGNPKYQGIDTSFLMATLTAAIQELKAEFDAYKASHP